MPRLKLLHVVKGPLVNGATKFIMSQYSLSTHMPAFVNRDYSDELVLK